MPAIKNYKHISNGEYPATIKEALALFGTQEIQGSSDNPKILQWAKEVEEAIGVAHLGYTADSIPWCGLFVAVCCVRAGWKDQIPHTPLWAKSWLTFGQPGVEPSVGDVLVFGRDGGGHVAFYVAEDDDCYHVLGGNQSDMVNITRIMKTRMLGARRPIWKVSCPAPVMPRHVDAIGRVSINEQ